MTTFKFKIVFFLILIPFFCFSQKKEVKIILNSKQLKNCSYEIYKPTVQIKMMYKDTTEAKNKTLEQLMTSIISAKNQEWVNYNSFGGKEKAAPFTKSEFDEKYNNKSKNYFELLAKLEFSVDSLKYFVIKFRYFQAKVKKPIMGSILMTFSKGRWYQTFDAKITNLSMMMLVFKEDIVERILLGTGSSSLENDLIKIVYKDGLNIDLLFQQDFNQEQKTYFINDLNWEK
ncbi:hypothetical protein NTJ28_002020 [Flavobacterium psychrophilum]|nr:hypothetical protein [Flavobacterium psychrophilum]EKT4510250.1 hypothetical protein [Flavobacterium psychrophilum]